MGFIVPPPPGHPRERAIWLALFRAQRIQTGVLFFGFLVLILMLLLCLILSRGGEA